MRPLHLDLHAVLSLRSVLLVGALALVGCRGRPPDVVLIAVDTLRADHVGYLNPDSPSRTPSIDALAAQGTVYTQAYSPISVTGPAFCSLMTGQEPATHGVVVNLFRGGTALPDSAETLAERLLEDGFATGGFVSGFTLRRALGLTQGFQRYRTPEKTRRRWSAGTTASALNWLSKQDGRVFLFWHSYDAHGPWGRWKGGQKETDPTPVGGLTWAQGGDELARIPEYQRVRDISDHEYYERGYASAVEYADTQVGRLVEALRESDRYDRALIVFLADHGESLTERGLWFDHGTTAHEEQLRVPLIVKWPDNVRAGERRDELVSLVDVAPTVLDVIGLRPLAVSDGVSLVQAGAGHERLVGESSHCKGEAALSCAPRGVAGKQFAVRDKRLTVLHEAIDEGARRSVYDRVVDRAERHPLDEPVPAALGEVLDATLTVRAAMPVVEMPSGSDEGSGEEDSDAETEMLQSLGYIDGPDAEGDE